MNETERRSLRLVLGDLSFPAHRWEVITAAGWYGADAVTIRRLQTLPVRDRPYRDLRDLVTALERAATARR